MKNKKIIFSTYDSIGNPIFNGGGAIAIHEIAKRLTSFYDVTVISGQFKGSKNLIIDHVSYKRIGFTNNPKIGHILFHILLPFYAMRSVYDVWIESFTPPFSTTCTQLFTKKPVIGLAHMLSGVDMKRKYKFPFDIIEAFGLRTYKLFLVLTTETKKRIQKVNTTARLVTIANGVDHIKSNVKRKNKHILFIGRIEINQKGIDVLLRAYKKISNKISIPLVIAGNGEEKQIAILKKIIADLGLHKKVFFVGRVEGEKKEMLYNEAFCVIIPSRYETQSLVATEALVRKIPLVISNIEGLQWIPKNNSVTFVSNNTASLAKAIVKVVTDKAIQKKLYRSLHKAIKQDSWDSVARKYKKFIETII